MDVDLDRPIVSIQPGTSGLRKTVEEFKQPHLIEVYAQTVLNILGHNPGQSTFIVGGDGRHYNEALFQRLLSVLAGNGVKKLIVPLNLLASTPCCSYLIKSYAATGGFILSASHNPGGPEGDAGLKYNIESGAPAPDEFNHQLTQQSRHCLRYTCLDPSRFGRCYDALDLSMVGMFSVGDTIVEIIDSVKLYADYALSHFKPSVHVQLLLRHPQFGAFFDAMHAVSGPFIMKVLECLQQHCNFEKGEDPLTIKVLQHVVQKFPIRCHIFHDTPFPDFHGIHPDPSLLNNPELVNYTRINTDEMYEGIIMHPTAISDSAHQDEDTLDTEQHRQCPHETQKHHNGNCTSVHPLARRYSRSSSFINQTNQIPCFIGFGFDGDGDRALIVGPNTFLSPSDNLAIITACAWCLSSCFDQQYRLHKPYTGSHLTGVARSFPTSSALDAVCKALGIQMYQTPTGFKYFGALLDADLIQLCGEESFGLGLSSIREKDGVMVSLLWIHILAYMNSSILTQWKDQLATFLPEGSSSKTNRYLSEGSQHATQSSQSFSSSGSIRSLNDFSLDFTQYDNQQTHHDPSTPSTPPPLSSQNPFKFSTTTTPNVSQSQTYYQHHSQPRMGLPSYQRPKEEDDQYPPPVALSFNLQQTESLPPSAFLPHREGLDHDHLQDDSNYAPFSQNQHDSIANKVYGLQAVTPPFQALSLISLQSIQHAFYYTFGRSYYIRLDYNHVPQHIVDVVSHNLSLLQAFCLDNKTQQRAGGGGPVFQRYLQSVTTQWDITSAQFARQRKGSPFAQHLEKKVASPLDGNSLDDDMVEMKRDKYDEMADDHQHPFNTANASHDHPIYNLLSTMTKAEDFVYTDPVSGKTSQNHGFVLEFSRSIPNSSLEAAASPDLSQPSLRETYRCIIRRSGTATGAGSTIRMYLDRYCPPHHITTPQSTMSHQISAEVIRQRAIEFQQQQLSLPLSLNLSLGEALFEFVNVITHLTQIVNAFLTPSVIT